MKKILLSLLALVVAAISLTACTPAKVYKYGIGVVMSVSTKDAVAATETTEAADGNYGVNVDFVTVVLDKDGKIVSATWDVAQTSNLKFNASGVHTTDLATYVLKTKFEKGEDYNMAKSDCVVGDTICKEWFEQSTFMTDFVVGMDRAAVAAIELADGYAADEDILVGTTIHINAFQAALLKAIDSAVEVKNVASYGVASVIAVTAKDAVAATETTEAADGNYGVNVDLALVTLDKDGKILSTFWDVAQASNLKFNPSGVHTTDLATYVLKTKFEKGEDYNMAKSDCVVGDTICKEWFQQAEFISDFVKGMDKAGVAAIELADGYAADEDILVGTTIHINSFQAVVVKAIENAEEVK